MTDDIRRLLASPDLMPHEIREGFNMRFPVVIPFEHLDFCFYVLQGYRKVAAGEYYLTSTDTDNDSLVEATYAPADIPVDRWVVRPTFKARCVSLNWELGEPVTSVPPKDPASDPNDSQR